MSFSNIQLQTESLPKVREVAFNLLKKDYRLVSVLGEMIRWLILFVIVTMSLFINPLNLPANINLSLLAVISVLAIARVVFVYIAFKYKGYALRQKDILYKRGYFWKSQTSIPFNRVQHCEVKQGPIERMFDLAQLNVFTAGGSASDLRIPGLGPDEANSLKHFILNKTSVLIEEEE